MRLLLQGLSSIIPSAPGCTRLLDPAAYRELFAVFMESHSFVLTDTWRGPDLCLLARRRDRTQKLPGYSPYSFGIAARFEHEQLGDTAYQDLMKVLERHGWYAVGSDNARRGEIQYLGSDGREWLVNLETEDPTSWGKVAEHKIYERYVKDFLLSPAQMQSALISLGFYSGVADGEFNAQSREALQAFQRAWMGDHYDPGSPSCYTNQRVLAVVAASVETLT